MTKTRPDMIGNKWGTKHGMDGTPIYRLWCHIRERCASDEPRVRKCYKDRGIKVCERWQDFSAFYADVGDKPTPKHQLDRYPDNLGDYKPGNTRWASARENLMNRTTTRLVEFRGQIRPLIDLSREIGIPLSTVYNRIARGASPEWALIKPVRRTKPKPPTEVAA